MISDVVYETSANGKHALDIYVPAREGGPWPVAVMLHGGGGYPLLPSAASVAAAGIVVYAPIWKDTHPWPNAAALRAGARETLGMIGCAVRFARTTAGQYGGDAARLSLYGHSGGANNAAMIAFSDAEVAPGCFGSPGSVVPDNLILFEGDWLGLGDPTWEPLLREDPSVFDEAWPWAHLEAATRLPVHLLDSNDPSLSGPYSDAAMVLRDPSGDLRRRIEELGLVSDGVFSEYDADRLLQDRLVSLGYDASIDVLPGSFHTFISDAARPIVIAAFLGG